jgi:hypothetical protein
MSTSVVITVKWMDGAESIYRDVTHRVADGVLTIEEPPPHGLGDEFKRVFDRRTGRTTLHLILANMRQYTVEERP